MHHARMCGAKVGQLLQRSALLHSHPTAQAVRSHNVVSLSIYSLNLLPRSSPIVILCLCNTRHRVTIFNNVGHVPATGMIPFRLMCSDLGIQSTF